MDFTGRKFIDFGCVFVSPSAVILVQVNLSFFNPFSPGKIKYGETLPGKKHCLDQQRVFSFSEVDGYEFVFNIPKRAENMKN